MSDSASQDRDRPVVAIYRSPLFNPSETFIQAQAAGLRRYRPLIVGRQLKGHVRPELEGRLLVSPSAETLRRHRPALIHAHFGTDGLAALPLATRLGIPLVTTLHGHEITRSRARLLLSGRASWMRYAVSRSRLIRQGDLFLAVSEAIRRRALGQGFPPERTLTHPIGADLARFRPGGEPEPGLILHVGRLVEKKGTGFLLDAFARVAADMAKARLVVIGDGPLRPALERQAARLGLGDRLLFLGARPAGEIAGWMQKAWLLAVPSVTAGDGDSEGLPTVLVEAMGCGLPAVATLHGGIPEALVDGETGFLVAERDVEALADRLGRLLGSFDLRRRMGIAARERAEREFDLIRQTARLEALYDKLIRDP